MHEQLVYHDTLDSQLWSEFCEEALDIEAGLAYLHGEQQVQRSPAHFSEFDVYCLTRHLLFQYMHADLPDDVAQAWYHGCLGAATGSRSSQVLQGTGMSVAGLPTEAKDSPRADESSQASSNARPRISDGECGAVRNAMRRWDAAQDAKLERERRQLLLKLRLHLSRLGMDASSQDQVLDSMEDLERDDLAQRMEAWGL